MSGCSWGCPVDCWCYDCHMRLIERHYAERIFDSLRYHHMYVCPDCGNKRCPKATCHDHACTGSNEPGQAGSHYGGFCACGTARPTCDGRAGDR